MVDFDWQIEAENGPQRVEEDPAAVAERQRQARRWRILAAVLLTVLIGGGSGAALRLRYVNHQRRIALEETVAAEALALRVGDRQAFLSAQAEIESWHAFQEARFERYAALGQRLTVTGELVDLEIDGDQALAALLEDVDGDTYHATWFYGYVDGQWRHIPTPDAWWGSQPSLRHDYLDIHYRTVDRAYVNNVLFPAMRRATGFLCVLSKCERSRPEIVIYVDPDSASDLPVLIPTDDGARIEIPSPSRDRIPASGFEPGLCDAACMELVIGTLLDQWISLRMQGAHPWSSMAWMEPELDRWLANQLDPTAPRSKVIDALQAAIGSDFAGRMLSGVQTAPPSDVLAVLLEEAFADERVMADPETMLAAYLRAELALYEVSSQQSELSIGDPVRQSGGGSFMRPTLAGADPASIEIAHIEQDGAVLWATVSYRDLIAAEDDPAGYRVELFRLVDGRWYHTPPSSDDWGTGTTLSGDGVVVRYRELDRLYGEGVFESVTAARGQIIADFTLPETTIFEVTISPAEQEVLTAFIPPIVSRSDALVVIVSSPYNGDLRPDLPGQTLNGQLEIEVLSELMRRLIRRQTGEVGLNALQEALIRYDLQRQGYDAELRPLDEVPDNAASSDDECATGFSLDALWDYAEACEGQRRLNRQGAAVLIELLVSRYGDEAIPGLHQNLDAVDLDAWLQDSLAIRLDDVDAEWRVRLETEYGGSSIVD